MRSERKMTQIIDYKAVGSINAANAIRFQNELMTAVNSQEGSIILVDMKEVEFLDSAGLMALITAYKSAKNRGKSLNICSVSPSVRIIFELSQLDQIFEIFENKSHFKGNFSTPLAA